MIQNLPASNVGVEVGVLEGWFSEQILSTPVKKLYLIDAWKHQEEGYTDPANIGQNGQDRRYHLVYEKFKNDKRVEIIRDWSTSDTVLHKLLDNIPDWAYIDANHTFENVLEDLNFYSKLTSHLFLHDYVDNDKSKAMNFGVIKAVDAFLKNNLDWKIANISDEEWPTVELIKNVA
jgi:hypothetical protein